MAPNGIRPSRIIAAAADNMDMELGGDIAQLHVHIVSRRSDDAAWPDPVWGHSTAEPYSPDRLGKARAAALTVFEEAGFFSAS